MDTTTTTTNETALRMLPRVEKIAKGFARKLPQHIDVADLVSVGVIGMLAALKAYDATRCSSLEAYVERRVRGAIQDELRAMDPLTRDERKDARRIDDATRSLEIELGRRAEVREIAVRAELSIERVRVLAERVAAVTAGPLDEDLLPVRDADALEQLSRLETMERLAAAIAALPERQRTVLGLYYLEELSLAEIADMLGVTQSRVCQISGEAVKRLRVALADA